MQFVQVGAALVLLLSVADYEDFLLAVWFATLYSLFVRPVSLAGFYRLLLRYRRLKNTLMILSFSDVWFRKLCLSWYSCSYYKVAF